MSDDALALQRRVFGMRAEGFSLRDIGRELGVSRMKVSRVLAMGAAPAAGAVPAAAGGGALDDDGEIDGDPLLLSLLSAADFALLGVAGSDLVGHRGNELHVYRMRGLVLTPRGGEARARLSGSEWVAWLLRESGASDRVDGADGPVPQHVRDARIVELRRSGWTLEAIAEETGMAGKGSVSNALARIARELETPKPVRQRRPPGINRERPDPSEEW